MITSEATDKIAPLLVAALNEFSCLAPGGTANVPTKAGGSYSYSYLTLPQTLDQAREILSKHQLAFHQDVSGEGQRVFVTTRIWHVSGQWVESAATPMPAAGGAQDIGSSITYGRRYNLLAFLGIAAAGDDDDGKRAQDAAEEAKKPHPLSDDVAQVQKELRGLSDADKKAIKEWANGRPLSAASMLQNEVWLREVEAYLDEPRTVS